MPFALSPKLLAQRKRTKGITRHSLWVLQAVKKAEKRITRSIAAVSALERCGLGKCLFLHGECCFEIDLCCFHRFVPESQCDDGAVHPLLEQIKSHRVSQHMDGDTLVL